MSAIDFNLHLCTYLIFAGYSDFLLVSSVWLYVISISSCKFLCSNQLHINSKLGFKCNYYKFSSVSSVSQSCPTLCDPINRSTPGLPVHHQLPEFTLTPAHRVSDAIQPSHPRSSPSPPAPNPSQHQSLFQ